MLSSLQLLVISLYEWATYISEFAAVIGQLYNTKGDSIRSPDQARPAGPRSQFLQSYRQEY